MKKEDLFTDEFLKQFKTGDELSSFLKQLQKRGIEKMLEGELDGNPQESRKEWMLICLRSQEKRKLMYRSISFGSTIISL